MLLMVVYDMQVSAFSSEERRKRAVLIGIGAMLILSIMATTTNVHGDVLDDDAFSADESDIAALDRKTERLLNMGSDDEYVSSDDGEEW